MRDFDLNEVSPVDPNSYLASTKTCAFFNDDDASDTLKLLRYIESGKEKQVKNMLFHNSQLLSKQIFPFTDRTGGQFETRVSPWQLIICLRDTALLEIAFQATHSTTGSQEELTSNFKRLLTQLEQLTNEQVIYKRHGKAINPLYNFQLLLDIHDAMPKVEEKKDWKQFCLNLGKHQRTAPVWILQKMCTFAANKDNWPLRQSDRGLRGYEGGNKVNTYTTFAEMKENYLIVRGNNSRAKCISESGMMYADPKKINLDAGRIRKLSKICCNTFDKLPETIEFRREEAYKFRKKNSLFKPCEDQEARHLLLCVDLNEKELFTEMLRHNPQLLLTQILFIDQHSAIFKKVSALQFILCFNDKNNPIYDIALSTIKEQDFRDNLPVALEQLETILEEGLTYKQNGKKKATTRFPDYEQISELKVTLKEKAEPSSIASQLM